MNTNQKYVVGGLALIVVIAGAILWKSENSTSDTMVNEPNAMMENTNAMEQPSGNAMMEDGKTNENAMMQAEGGSYQIQSESQVSYTAQKKWFNKPTEEVTGTNTDVTGTFSYDESTNTITELMAEVDSQGFTTGSEGRDKEVQKMLQGKIVIKNTAPITNVTSGDISFTAPLEITINGKTTIAEFAITGKIEGQTITATGKSTLSLADVEVTAPSLLSVYTVDDIIGISFSMTARK